MLGKTDKNPQLTIAEVPLVHFIDPNHELCRLVRNADWANVEKELAVYYSPKGAPSVPIRIMVGLILLKQVYHYSDKSALLHWVENPYWQYFCGETYFQHKAPFYFSDFSHFRKRIGKDGIEKIITLGTDVFGPAFTRGLSGKKGQAGLHRGIISDVLSRLGNFLVRLSEP
jgi:transposase, IS5 family